MRVLLAGIALCFLSTPVAAQDAEALIKKHGCVTCHAVDKTLVGPPYKEVAKKYAGQKDADKKLVEKVTKGGSGVWGQVPMPPAAGVPAADIQAMVKWVLALK